MINNLPIKSAIQLLFRSTDWKENFRMYSFQNQG